MNSVLPFSQSQGEGSRAFLAAPGLFQGLFGSSWAAFGRIFWPFVGLFGGCRRLLASLGRLLSIHWSLWGLFFRVPGRRGAQETDKEAKTEFQKSAVLESFLRGRFWIPFQFAFAVGSPPENCNFAWGIPQKRRLYQVTKKHRKMHKQISKK